MKKALHKFQVGGFPTSSWGLPNLNVGQLLKSHKNAGIVWEASKLI